MIVHIDMEAIKAMVFINYDLPYEANIMYELNIMILNWLSSFNLYDKEFYFNNIYLSI